jgi:hypothetical protein
VLVWNDCTQYCKTNKGVQDFHSCVSLALGDSGYNLGELHLGTSCGKAATSAQSRNRVGWVGALVGVFAVLASVR